MLLAGDIGGAKTELTVFSSEAGPHLPIGRSRMHSAQDIRRNKMRSSIPDESNKLEVATTSLCDPGADDSLVVAAKTGDELAFETLVKRHQKRIFALALRYTRVREDAQDVVQQTFHKAFVYLHKFEGKSLFSTWLTRIAINEALMLLRRGRAMREVSIDDSSSDEGIALQIHDAGPDPEAEYLQREGLRILSAAMGQLRPGIRGAIELRELGELTSQETARRLGLSISAVKGRVFQGRRKLRQALRRYVRSPRMQKGITGNPRRISRDRLPRNAPVLHPLPRSIHSSKTWSGNPQSVLFRR
jgi:RNA polymerase sigma-70 factor (ECF subfamily)